MDVQRKSLRQINDRVVTLEKIMIDSHILLEKIRSTIQQDDKSLPESHKFIHILSRESPYVYTNEARYPVTEKYIAWKVNSLSKVDFSIAIGRAGPVRSLRSNSDHPGEREQLFPRRRTTVCRTEPVSVARLMSFVLHDQCALRLKTSATDDTPQVVTDIHVIPATPLSLSGTLGGLEPAMSQMIGELNIPLSEYKWNQIVELQLHDGKKVRSPQETPLRSALRRILDDCRSNHLGDQCDDQNTDDLSTRHPTVATLVSRSDRRWPGVDLLSPHRNPMGRTGVRGRGALVRWGPNKSIMAIITRWKKHRGQFAVVDGQRLLEAMVFKDKFVNDWKLPGVRLSRRPSH